MLTPSTPLGTEIVMVRSPVANIPRKGDRARLVRWVDSKTRDQLCVVSNAQFPNGKMIMAAWARRADLPASITGLLAGANAPGLQTIYLQDDFGSRLALIWAKGYPLKAARARRDRVGDPQP